MQQQEIFRLMVHRIEISESTKKPTVTLEMFFKNDDGDWEGSGAMTMAIGNSVSMFAEAMSAPIPWKNDKGNKDEH